MTAQSATTMQPVKESVSVRRGSEDWVEHFDGIYDSIARRAFELSQGHTRSAADQVDDWLRAEAELLHPVHMDISESDDQFTLQAEVPGFSAKDLEIKVEPRRLILAGRREVKNEKPGRKICSEWCADHIYRAIDLPVDLDVLQVAANLKNGMLKIDLPKAQHAKTTRIEPRPI